ncbi:hypothetical protein Achl_1074 [Pseudarthrobacter chlorophenolicus A6]|uniref:Uncharacterized protein n=1 Tax=Pseudarthrobacter chlorophenolicus (strain ATCC 700700 / DSM 12829 / CIP 107037 / JCM 12360 / KCTC 9906 / NCIMB 13794 / A6) TaxID=452863 RepID=B8HE33_PSECP|nr:hypothetical protein [Pseudarthrobacter chlorophenolicus]ACL39068.1 hypothetical protein Achl_1074 [Pseudarthrobacter chlorophenolicus A6]SDR04842.1 hypothetical protein SAMN04489738_4452 [Pseudarthrobacter chlorophenolicus]
MKSTWASDIKNQLLTFNGYIDPVEGKEQHEQTGAGFAEQDFGSSPDAEDEPGVRLNSPALGEIATALGKATFGK